MSSQTGKRAGILYEQFSDRIIEEYFISEVILYTSISHFGTLMSNESGIKGFFFGNWNLPSGTILFHFYKNKNERF